MATTCELIAKNVLGSDTATVTFSSIPGTYDDIVFCLSGRADGGTTNRRILISFNGSSSDYTMRGVYGTSSSVSSVTQANYGDNHVGYLPGATTTASTFGNCEIYIPNYAGSTNKSLSATSVSEDNSVNGFVMATAGLWSQTAALTEIAFTLSASASYVTNSSFFLYGITKA